MVKDQVEFSIERFFHLTAQAGQVKFGTALSSSELTGSRSLNIPVQEQVGVFRLSTSCRTISAACRKGLLPQDRPSEAWKLLRTATGVLVSHRF